MTAKSILIETIWVKTGLLSLFSRYVQEMLTQEAFCFMPLQHLVCCKSGVAFGALELVVVFVGYVVHMVPASFG